MLQPRGPRPVSGDTEGFGWVDDVAILAVSSTYHENVQLLERTLAKADLWARRHAARFAPEKFELIHFNNPRANTVMEEDVRESLNEPDPYDICAMYPQGNDRMPVMVHGRDPLKPVQQAKYLGIWLDKTLSFDKHRAYTMAKANGSLEALRGITGSIWGVSLPGMRKIYQAVVVPQLLYGLSA